MGHFDPRLRIHRFHRTFKRYTYIQRCLQFPRGATPQPPRDFTKSMESRQSFLIVGWGIPDPTTLHCPCPCRSTETPAEESLTKFSLPKLWPLPFKDVSALDRSTISRIDFSKAFFVRWRVIQFLWDRENFKESDNTE